MEFTSNELKAQIENLRAIQTWEVFEIIFECSHGNAVHSYLKPSEIFKKNLEN